MRRPIVYLIRKRGLGDVLWIEPVIRQLAKLNKKVIVYTKFPELFENYPLTNVVFKKNLTIIEKIGWKLDNILDTSFVFITLEMAYEKKPKIHFLHAYQMKAALPITEEYPKLYISKKESETPAMFNKYVVLHLESLTDKNYRKVYGIDWLAIKTHLANKGYSIIQIGKEPLSIEGTEHIKTSIREMIVLISRCSFFIGIDSGPSHIAASLGIPSLIFFGAVNPDFRHFKKIFSGFFLQQYCEFAGCYHETISKTGPDCKLVGKDGIPKCSLHTSEYVIRHIDLLIQQYHLNDTQIDWKN